MSKASKILGFGAFGLALLAASKNAQTAAVVQDIAPNPLPFAEQKNITSIEEVIANIRSNGTIKRLLQGEKGDKGDKGNKIYFNLESNLLQNESLYKEGDIIISENWNVFQRNYNETYRTIVYENPLIPEFLPDLYYYFDLKGNIKGRTGDTGDTGVENFSGSMLENGALEYGNTQNFVGGEIGTTVTNGMLNIVKSSTNLIRYNKPIRIDSRKLYKANFLYKMAESGFIEATAPKDRNLQNLVKGTGQAQIYPFGSSCPSSLTFVEKTVYFGGGTNQSAGFEPNTNFIDITIRCNGAMEITNLVFVQVLLGEAVPFNLPFLPVGQTVFDPTTNKLGRYTGSTIVWSA